jgi:Protein of unknown function (DUF1640)
MTAFDTHAFVKKLQDAGFSEQQAEAQVQVFSEIIGGNLATKLDITEVKHDIEALRLATRADSAEVKHDINLLEERSRGRFTLLQWMIGFNLALTVIVLAKLFS